MHFGQQKAKVDQFQRNNRQKTVIFEERQGIITINHKSGQNLYDTELSGGQKVGVYHHQ